MILRSQAHGRVQDRVRPRQNRRVALTITNALGLLRSRVRKSLGKT